MPACLKQPSAQHQDFVLYWPKPQTPHIFKTPFHSDPWVNVHGFIVSLCTSIMLVSLWSWQQWSKDPYSGLLSPPGHLPLSHCNPASALFLDKRELQTQSLWHLTSMGRQIRFSTDLSTETWQARKGWQDIFNVRNQKNMEPRILYPARLSSKIEGR